MKVIFWLTVSCCFTIGGIAFGHQGLSWSLVGAVLAAGGAILMLVHHTKPKI